MSSAGIAESAIGVLVMAYGGPSSLEEIPGYLADIRDGRPTPRSVVEEITAHYRLIGGRSPILDISRRQVACLQERLGSGFRCAAGMRHWFPWIEEAVGEMEEQGIRRAVGIILAPHYSRLNSERYFSRVEDGRRIHRSGIEFSFVKGYHDSPHLIEALAGRVEEGLACWPAEERPKVHVVFSAHSLPARILREGDPYDAQLHETAALVARRAGLSDGGWSWSYQSAGKSPEPWLGPQLEDHIPALAGRGIRDIVCVPVGFVSDHVEILYDIDIEARAAAEKAGVRLERPRALNDDPLFIEALSDAVKRAVSEAGWTS
ncbi:MAG: ferrochelatase [Spirochaetia bacterium]|jgi:ferrochelatase